MAPNYKMYSGFTVRDALEAAGPPKDQSYFAVGEPPVTFFTQAPKDSAAVFSTHSNRPFRLVENPTYERPGKFWWAAEIQRVCDELRRMMPEACKNIEPPRDYWDLYKYFDAYDIYNRGAQNLWNVINTFVFENEYAQGLVDKEQRAQTELYSPLFESLAVGLLKKPDIQTKLLSWGKEKQQDILEVLTAQELQCFQGYEKYPEHFREAIRIIFARYHDDLLKGLPFAEGLTSASSRIPKIDIPEKLAELRLYLHNLEAGDPFLDKFDIPNRIVNGIVIVDGTSKTAARRAKEIHASTNSHNPQKVQQGNGAVGLPAGNWAPIEYIAPQPEGGDANYAQRRRSTFTRCSSAPSVGGDPGSILTHPVNEEARVYPGGSHDVEEKLMGCQKPATQEAPQVAVTPTTDNNLQHAPTTGRSLPPIHYNDRSRRTGDHQSSSARQPMLYTPSNTIPGPIPPNGQSVIRDRGISQGPFVNQIPPYTLPQQHVQAPPHMMQQTRQSFRLPIPPNGVGYTTNATPPYFRADPMQQHRAPSTLARGPESFRQDKRDSVTRNFSSGKWQHIGSDDIHGPRVVFRRGSVHDQWQGKESGVSGRRTSATSNNGGHRQFNNAHPQQFNNHVGPRQANRVNSTTRRNSRTSENMGFALSEYGCVNAGKNADLFTKFDPCPCTTCWERNRTIYVNGLKPNIFKDETAVELLKKHFSKFGELYSIQQHFTNTSAAHVKFNNPTSAVAAVQAERHVKIDGLGDLPFHVNFRTGSQFFTPRARNNSTSCSNNNRYSISREQGLTMHPPMASGLDKSHVNSTPFQYKYNSPEGPIISPSFTGSVGQPPVISPNTTAGHAMDTWDRAAAQSGFRMKGPRGGSVPRMSGSAATLPPLRGPISGYAPNTQTTAGRHSRHGSQFSGVPSHATNDDMVRNIADLTHEVNTSRQASYHSTPSHARQLSVLSSHAQGTPARVSENGDSIKLTEAVILDYGTVRIRPEKAQYIPIPGDWRQDSTPLHAVHGPASQPFEAGQQIDQGSTAGTIGQAIQPTLSATTGSQQIQPTERCSGDITAQTQRKGNRDKILLEDGSQNRIRSASTHSKRKAGETDEDGKTPGQPLPKKLAKVGQEGDPRRQGQSSRPGDQQHKDGTGETRQTKTGKKNNNKNKNSSKRRNQAPSAETPNTSAPAPYEAQTFEPAITASNLPAYPRHVENRAVSQPGVSHLPEPVYVRIPPARAVSMNQGSNGPEPFPPYRDLMSGPQQVIWGHKRHTSGLGHRPSLSDASTIILQDSSWRSQSFNPGAENFIPSPPAMSSGPGPGQRQNGRNGKGKGKPQKGKGVRNDQKTANQALDDRKPELTTTNELRDGTPKNVGDLAKGRPSNGSPDRKGLKDVEKDRREKGKEEPEKLAENTRPSPPTTKSKPKNDKTTELQDLRRPESRADLDSLKRADTRIASSSSLASSSSDPKSRKPKTQGGFNKTVGSQRAAKNNNNNKAESTTTATKEADINSPAKPVLNAADFPALPSAPAPKLKPVPALAPIPLRVPGRAVTGPWRTVSAPVTAKSNRSGPASSTKDSKKALKDGEKAEIGDNGPPDGERKGG
ncbi:hypothetical protein F5Y10DRAFT_287388 [Nemania abortiva]|nr:hypothetical protein F5Y10DRAFT_287388 [Nemania abortiva]